MDKRYKLTDSGTFVYNVVTLSLPLENMSTRVNRAKNKDIFKSSTEGCPKMVQSGMVLMGVLVFLAFLGLADSACPTKTKGFYNKIENKFVCCFDIECPAGQQPVVCLSKDPSSVKCEECPYKHYNDRKVSLHSDSYQCRIKRNCIHYLIEGDVTVDAQCHCPSAQEHLDQDTKSLCLPNIECPKGFGQTEKGTCERCQHGVTYSNESNNHQRCIPVTICRDHYRCTIKEANISSDAICGPVESDIDNCPPPNAASNSTVKPAEKEKEIHEGEGPEKENDVTDKKRPNKPNDDGGGGGKNVSGIIAWTVLPLLVVICLIYVVRRKCRKANFERHIQIARDLQHIADDENLNLRNEIYQFVGDKLKNEACTKAEYLGKILLGQRVETIIKELEDPNKEDLEKMNLVLDRWSSACNNGPNIEELFRAMYHPDHSYQFPSLAREIIARFDLSISNTSYRHWYQYLPCHGIFTNCPRNMQRRGWSSRDARVEYSPTQSALNSSSTLVTLPSPSTDGTFASRQLTVEMD